MKPGKIALILSAAIFLSACISAPMTPDEYRKTAKVGKGFSTFESFDVKRPVSKVAKTFRLKADKCLNISMSSTKKPYIGIGSVSHTYGWTTPTVKVMNNRAELYFQVKYENTVGKMPEDGMYHLVADAYSIGKNKTRIDIYRRTSMEALAQSIRGWASGKNLSCTDPSEFL